MRKRIVLLLTVLFSLACLHTAAYAREVVFPDGDSSQYVTGTGTEDDPYVFIACGSEENIFHFDGTAWIGSLEDITIATVDDSQEVVARYGVTVGNHGQKYARFYTNIKTVPAEGIFKITATPMSGAKRSCYLKLVLTGIGGVTGIDTVYDGEEKEGYVGIPKLMTPNDVIYDGLEHFTITYQDADGKEMNGKPTEVGKYSVTFVLKDEERHKPYKGRLTLPFSILEEPEAKYQAKKGGTWIESSFREAVVYVYDGGTVKLLKDISLEYGTVSLNKDMTITSNKSICTIASLTDQHGYLLQVGAEATIQNIIIDGGSKEGLTASRALIAIGDSGTSGKLTIGKGTVLCNNKNTTKNGGGGGAVLFDGECILDGGEISGNSAGSGGGIYARAGKIIVKNGEITKNSCTWYGGGIYISAGKCTIYDGEISDNTAGYGGGIFALNAECEVNGGEINDNSSTVYGGGIDMQGGKWIFNDGEINGNTAQYGGGAYLLNMTGICEINGGEICDNTATRLGGAIHLNLSIKLNISGGTITGNKVVKQWGGGIEVAPGCELTLSGSPVIAKNTSPEETDGGLYYDYSPPSGETIFEMDEMGADAAVSWKTYMESRLGTLSGKRLLMAVPMNREAITDYDLSKQDYDSEDYDLVLIDGEMYLVERVQAEKITIDPKELKMEVGEKETLTATLTPEDTTVPITWTSSNEKIATVDNGIVTAKKAGKATITATIPNGESASCEVTVTEKESTSTASTVTSKKYKITLKDTENGMVKASHKTAKKGTIVTVMAIPDADYVLHSLTVLDRDGRKLNVTDNGDYTYSFQMTRSSVTVTAEFLAEETDPVDVDTMNAVILKINDRWSWAFGDAIRNDVAPEIRNERMMLPIRFIAENLGGTVVWNTAEQKTVIVKEGNVIEIPIGQTTAYVNGEAIELDSPAYIANDRTYLPLRFVAENLDAEVIWKADTQQVYIIPHEK